MFMDGSLRNGSHEKKLCLYPSCQGFPVVLCTVGDFVLELAIGGMAADVPLPRTSGSSADPADSLHSQLIPAETDTGTNLPLSFRNTFSCWVPV